MQDTQIYTNAGHVDVAQGSVSIPRTDRQSAQLVSGLHGKYFELARSGRVFTGSNQAAQAWTVGLATTYTGLLVWNPISSQVNLEILFVGFAHSAVPTTIATIGLIGSGAALTTDIATNGGALTPYCTKIGPGAGYGRVTGGCTLTSTPVWIGQLLHGFTSNALPTGGSPALIDVEGAFVVQPGAYFGIGALTVATGLASITWAETPI